MEKYIGFTLKPMHQWKIRNWIFVSKTIDFPLISTKDKMISTVEDSKKKKGNIDYLRNIIIALEIR